LSDLGILNGKPRVLKVGDREYRFHPLTLDDLGELQAWIDSRQPDPFAIANAQVQSGKYTVEQGKFLLRTAMEMAVKGTPKLGTEDADLLLQSPDGIKEVLYLSVRKGDPGFSREDATELFRSVTQNDIAAVFQRSGLVDAGMVGGSEPDPKANGAGTPNPSPESRSTGGNSTTTLRPSGTGTRKRSAG